MTENQQDQVEFREGDRVAWDYGDNTFRGTIQEPARRRSARYGARAAGRGCRRGRKVRAGWLSADRLRHIYG